MRIRLATDRDSGALAALRWAFRAEDGEEEPVVSFDAFAAHHAEFFRAGLASGQRAHIVADAGDGTLLGHVVCQVIPLVPRPCRLDDACGLITDNYVRESDRNRGIGSALIRGAIAWARGTDLETLIVWPSDRARPFYARHGFSERTEVMELVLRSPHPAR